ncbi:tripartite tricarboxylate transporter substrate binding protein [Bordetella sp. BOR01]|nr:tripartite tricarboxylate transporter substrate binding protein [Bordetella sp. BOR01]
MKRAIVALLLTTMSGIAVAEAPSGPVTMINPFTVSGLTDLVARMVIEKARHRFPHGVVAMNRPGAGGSIGIAAVVQSKPQELTIGFTPTGAIVDVPQINDVAYKTPDDIAPIINIVSSYQLLAVRAEAPWKSAQEFIAAAKAAPGKLSLGYTGVGTAAHLNMAQLLQAADINVLEVPYPGWSQSSVALVGGHVDALVINAGEGRPMLDDGRLRILGVFQAERVGYYPDVPTFKELGYDIGVQLQFFFFGPKNMDPAARRYMHDAFKEVLDDPDFKNFVVSREVSINYMDGDATKAMLWSEYKAHTELLKSLGLLKK